MIIFFVVLSFKNRLKKNRSEMTIFFFCSVIVKILSIHVQFRLVLQKRLLYMYLKSWTIKIVSDVSNLLNSLSLVYGKLF
jgi:uncharacterized membrane protein